MDKETNDAVSLSPGAAVMATVGPLRDALDDKSKGILHSVAATRAPSYVVPEGIRESCAHLLKDGVRLHSLTADAILELAVEWHREAGRLVE